MTATAHTQLFDPNVTSNAAGDLWLEGIAAATPDPTILDRIKAAAAARATSGQIRSPGRRVSNLRRPRRSPSRSRCPPVPARSTSKPGESATITVTITPSGAKGSQVTGHLYIDDFNFFNYDGDELIDLPYAYSIK